MAAGHIWTRILADDFDNSLPAEHKPISIHALGAALIARAAGKVNDAWVINAFNLDTNGQADFTAIKAAYAAYSNKAEWLALIESAFILLKVGLASEAEAKAAVGIA